MMFVFRLDATTGIPPYLQLVQQVRQAVQLGFLCDGDRLPLMREVVEALAINPNTVAKAYRQLEHEGLVIGRPGQGTFVTGAPATTISPATYGMLRDRLRDWLAAARSAGLDSHGISALFASVHHDTKVDAP